LAIRAFWFQSVTRERGSVTAEISGLTTRFVEQASVDHHAGPCESGHPTEIHAISMKGLSKAEAADDPTPDAVNRGNNAGETEVLDLNQPV
jgi:hypothetical protein